MDDMFSLTPTRAEDFLLRTDPAEAAGALGAKGHSSDPRRLEEAAKQFEGLFIQQILKQMKEATAQLEPEEDEEASDRASSEHIKSLFWTFLGDAVTEQGGFGLWKTIHHQMASLAENEPTTELADVDGRI